MKLMMVVGTMMVVAGCAGSAEDSTSSLTSAVTAASSSSSGSGSDTADGKGGRDGHHRGPPPEAIAACDGKAAGDACTFSHDDQSIAGTCVAPPADAPADASIACRPDNMPEGGPPPGGGHDGPGGGGGDCQKDGQKPTDSAAGTSAGPS